MPDDYWKKYGEEQRLKDLKLLKRGFCITAMPNEHDLSRTNTAWRGKRSMGSRPMLLARRTPGEINAAE